MQSSLHLILFCVNINKKIIGEKMNIKQSLEYGIKVLKENKIEEPFLKARMLLSYILNVEKEYLILHDLEEISEENIKKYKECINRLINNEPLQYIIGKQEFYGIDFFVNKNVLIPQPDTEILVEEVINICKKEYQKSLDTINILDLCTGSGAIGIAIKKNTKNTKIVISDISKEALEVAKYNLNSVNEKNIKIIQSDLFENIIVSNPPYIKTSVIKELSKEVQNEPIIALDGGKDGLDIYKRIISKAYKYLKKDGFLCLEIGYDQLQDVIALINNNGKYKEIYSKKDINGKDRIIICKKE